MSQKMMSAVSLCIFHENIKEKHGQKESDYAKDVIYMTSFTTGEFYALLAKTGFTLLRSKQGLDDPKVCHEYFFFRKPGAG